jgi:MSHA biogenesis protein MshI
MGLFAKNKKASGWLAVSLQKDGICVAHVKRPASGAPIVELAASWPMSGTALSNVLEKVAKEAQAARYTGSNLLAATEYQLLSVDAPNVPADELKVAIRWRLKDMLDFHVDDAAIDVLDIPVDKNAPVRNHSMYAVAARNQVIQQRQELFEQAKFPLSVIDIPEMAQRNISALAETDGRGVAMLSFGEDGGLLTVTYAGELYLSRRIDAGPVQMQQAGEEQRDAFYDRVTLELQRSLDHFDRQYHFITLSKLLLAPLAEGYEGMQAYLASNLYLPVESLDLESVLDISRTPDLKRPDVQQRFFLTLGAALRHEETVL